MAYKSPVMILNSNRRSASHMVWQARQPHSNYLKFQRQLKNDIILHISVADQGISKPGCAAEFLGSGDCFDAP